ncbi:MAG: pyridoxal phosphate-dependent aminotransferase [Acidobacteriota bacterium]
MGGQAGTLTDGRQDYNVRVFSQRTSYSFAKNPLALALDARRKQRLEILDLTESNPTRVGFAYPEAAILKALGTPRSLVYQPEAFGLKSAREAVAAYYRERGKEVETRQIVLTASTSEAYSFLFKLLADPDDQVLIPQPSYPLFDFLARLNSVRTAQYPLVYDGSWRLDRSALTASLDSRTRAIVVVSPNNPTGSRLEHDDWQWLADLCADRQAPLIWDEVFHDYPLENEGQVFNPLHRPDVPAFLLNGLSKTAGLPQLKLAWIIVTGPEAFRRAALERLEIVADTFLSVGTPVQHALSGLLALRFSIQKEIRARLLENLAALRRTLAGSAAEVLPIEAGWCAVVRLPRVRSEDQWVVDLLEHSGTLIHPGYFYDFQEEPFGVLSLLPLPSVFERGVKALTYLL